MQPFVRASQTTKAPSELRVDDKHNTNYKMVKSVRCSVTIQCYHEPRQTGLPPHQTRNGYYVKHDLVNSWGERTEDGDIRSKR